MFLTEPLREGDFRGTCQFVFNFLPLDDPTKKLGGYNMENKKRPVAESREDVSGRGPSVDFAFFQVFSTFVTDLKATSRKIIIFAK